MKKTELINNMKTKVASIGTNLTAADIDALANHAACLFIEGKSDAVITREIRKILAR